MREARGLTQRELAGGAFTTAFVSMIENGKAFPSLKSLLYLSDNLKVRVRDLLPPDL